MIYRGIEVSKPACYEPNHIHISWIYRYAYLSYRAVLLADAKSEARIGRSETTKSTPGIQDG